VCATRPYSEPDERSLHRQAIVIHFNIILKSEHLQNDLVPSSSSTQVLYAVFVFHGCFIPSPCHFPCLGTWIVFVAEYRIWCFSLYSNFSPHFISWPCHREKADNFLLTVWYRRPNKIKLLLLLVVVVVGIVRSRTKGHGVCLFIWVVVVVVVIVVVFIWTANELYIYLLNCNWALTRWQ
jgi:hypothetical protein